MVASAPVQSQIYVLKNELLGVLEMNKLINFLNRLEEANIHYNLDKVNREFVMVEVVVPGQRWEIEFSNDEVLIEKFLSDGSLFDESELITLLDNFSG